MKTKLPVILTLSALCLFSTTMSYADDDDRACVFSGNTVPMAQIEKNVQTLGFKLSKEFFEKDIKLTDGCVYKVKAKDNTGQKWKLYFDPTTGKLIARQAEHD